MQAEYHRLTMTNGSTLDSEPTDAVTVGDILRACAAARDLADDAVMDAAWG